MATVFKCPTFRLQNWTYEGREDEDVSWIISVWTRKLLFRKPEGRMAGDGRRRYNRPVIDNTTYNYAASVYGVKLCSFQLKESSEVDL